MDLTIRVVIIKLLKAVLCLIDHFNRKEKFDE